MAGLSQGSPFWSGGGGEIDKRVPMDVVRMLEELKREREAIEEAILTLERLAKGQIRRRGRPPGWMRELNKSQAVDQPIVAPIAQRGRGRKPVEATA